MKVFTQSINFKADQKLLNYIDKKIVALERFYDKIVDVEVFLKVQKTSEKQNKMAEIKINIPHNELIVKKKAKTFEEGVSLSVESLKRQLEKSKEKRKKSLAI